MTVFEELTEILIQKKLKITAAESCTGGLFASDLVDVPDASKVLSASFVTYSEEAKCKFAFVQPETIEKYGVVSEATAGEMCIGAAKNAGAQVSVGITGYAGPSGGDDKAKRGTVCFGFFVNGTIQTATTYTPELSRNELRENACRFAAKTLLDMLKNEGTGKNEA